jgi:hypothetical protein
LAHAHAVPQAQFAEPHVAGAGCWQPHWQVLPGQAAQVQAAGRWVSVIVSFPLVVRRRDVFDDRHFRRPRRIATAL